jgi:hypothetical protein
MPACPDHVLMENRSKLAADARPTWATGTAEVAAALESRERTQPSRSQDDRVRSRDSTRNCGESSISEDPDPRDPAAVADPPENAPSRRTKAVQIGDKLDELLAPDR